MDKLLWSWWSWLWNDQSSSTTPSATAGAGAVGAAAAADGTTISHPLLENIRNFTRRTIPTNRPYVTSPLPTTAKAQLDSLINRTLSTLSRIVTNHPTVSSVTTTSSPPSSFSSLPSESRDDFEILSTTTTSTGPSALIRSLFPSSFSSPAATATSLLRTIHEQQQKQPYQHHQQLKVQSHYSNFTTSSLPPLSSAFSTILDYETSYGSSADIFGNFSIPASSVDFSDDLSDVAISSGSVSFSDSVGVGIGTVGGRVGSVGTSFVGGDEFLFDLWNCSGALNGCCNRTSNGSFVGLFQNATVNCSTGFVPGAIEIETTLHLLIVLGTAIVLGIIILATVIGNVFVIAAILLERNLQSVANYLILSLAVADLLVACLVMPLSAVYEVSKEWKLGPELCDMWTSCDVLCCTASILHLVAIALDRYWAVTNIDYIHQRTARRIGVMILIIWALSFLVSIAPLLGWKDPKWDERVSKDFQCLVSQDIGYQIFATASSFYVPLLVILILYWRIFQTARKRIRRRQQVTATPTASGGGLVATAAGGSGGIAAAVVTVIGRPLPTISETTTAFTNISSTHTSPEKGSYGNGVDRIENDPPTADISTYGTSQIPNFRPTITRKKTQTSVDSKRERKAAKTLAIITGAFVCCWLPFFILAILLPTCQCDISPLAVSLSLWLGYFNSTLNPIIYTIFSPEFRHAFKRILCGRRNSIRRRTRCVRR